MTAFLKYGACLLYTSTTEYFQLLMEQESVGTQHFFARIGGWLQALENGALLVVDEIEDSLHPLLTRRLIEMVQDKAVNTKGAQLIFTTHDAMLLDLNFFRRDQIWFAEKNDETCATELYSLASFSPRKGENVRKGYLCLLYTSISARLGIRKPRKALIFRGF